MITLLLLLQQAPLPTVGDTLWANRSVRLKPGDSVRAGDWNLEGPVQLLGRPAITVNGDRAEVRYPLVAWEAGNHVVDVPGPIVTRASGVEDTLRTESMTFVVASVLPEGVPDSALQVQPPASLVPRGFTSLFPPIVLGSLAAVLLVPFHWWWNRRGRPAVSIRSADQPGPGNDMVRRWAEAGERRVVAGVASTRLREAIAQQVPSAHLGLDTVACLAEVERHRPDWLRDDLATTLLALDGMRFAPSRSDNVLDLYQRGMRLAGTIAGGRL